MVDNQADGPEQLGSQLEEVQQQIPQTQVPTDLVAEGVAAIAPEGSQSPKSEEATEQGKSIFLFSDGTGNSSAKLFKTNVWRMYEALDLGHAAQGQRVQIAYYDNGVGTSNFRPLRLLGGIFGIGLKTNVLRLYTFLCRNYQPGDRIYAFGFSRGAFTIRLLAGLIASQGVIRDSDPPKYLMRDAYRGVCRNVRPNQWPWWLAAGLKGIRDGLLFVKRKLLFQKLYRDVPRDFPDVEFVGVWDTVAAYGGPFAEITRGIDDWVWPLTMPNYTLSPKVRKARHALSLDDERDAFQPLLWDEFREEQHIARGRAAPDRLQQVWFSGVHSDVGGGYPDESLSYISLLWMIDEMGSDVRFIPHLVAHARSIANPFGPIHDSRSGFASYYRYQPRKLAAMMDPADPRYMAMRDPEIGRVPEFGAHWTKEEKERWKQHGLLRKARIHESALARIMSGIDSYAPAALPADFEIVPANGPQSRPSLTQQDYATLAAARPLEPLRAEEQERSWNWVWWRRIAYFATVALSLHLILLPILPWLDWIDALCSDDRCFARTVLEKPAFLLPASAGKLWAYYLTKPFALIIGVILLLILIGVGEVFERRFRGKVRTIWRNALNGTLSGTNGPSPIRSLRQSRPYQYLLYLVKWRVLPLIFGLSILFALLVSGATAMTQLAYAFMEQREGFCADRTDAQGVDLASSSLNSRIVQFSTDSPCQDLGINVKARHGYRIRLTVTEDWVDGGKDTALSNLTEQLFGWREEHPATPANGATTSSRFLRLAWPFNRVTSANYFEPLTEVRSHDLPGFWPSVREWLLGADIDIRTTDFHPVDGRYEMTFCTEQNGHLYMTVNDAGFAYGNNQGKAAVEVTSIGPVAEGTKCPDREKTQATATDK